MKSLELRNLLILVFLLFLSVCTSAQEYYNFDEDNPNKGKLALTPIGGIIGRTGGGVGFIASGRIQYFFSEYISAGVQYVQLFDTGNDDLGWFGDYAAPEQSAHIVVGGHYFPNHKRFGFHGTAGVGYIISRGQKLTTYFDIGIDFKLSKSTTVQLQIMEIGFAATGIGIGMQFKL